MPAEQLHADDAQLEVLTRAAKFSGVPPFAKKFAPVNFSLHKARDLYHRVRQSSNGFRLENLLAEMRVELRVDAADAARIPTSGPVVVVANHPLGMLDGAILAVLLTRVRPDVKVVTNSLLGDVPELRQHCIFVDPFESKHSMASNRRALKEARAWLQLGGMLALFPAGEVSQLQFAQAQIADLEWGHAAVRLIRKTGASALPVYFRGSNNAGFQLLGMVHPRLRMAFLLQEFLQQEGKTVEVRVGSEIPAESMAGIGDDHETTEYLRWRTYLLAQRSKAEMHPWPAAARSVLPRRIEAVASAMAQEVLSRELEKLPAERCLAENAEFGVYLVRAGEGPSLFQELGRLREVTFRAAGEGTGKSRDLDRFDDYYWHVLLWSKKKRELAGAYRAGNTVEILAKRGVSGLYTNTLFRYDARLFEKLGPALELGRSFVRPEYQRQYAPLLLLWKGIGQLVASHPDVPVLFGAVSISNEYSQASREIMYRFFEARMQEDELSGLIKPRRPFRPLRLRRWDCRAMCHALRDIEELSQPITDVERDGKGLPILLRQYAKIGGKLLGFNVDRKFSNVLDGLVVVDLRRTEATVLDRYMGREAAGRFRKFHGQQ